MKERPIIFNTPMVRAILEGRKTQTRRMIKLRHDADVVVVNGKVWKPARIDYAGYVDSPYGQPGDKLWVRETWGHAHITNRITGEDRFPVVYRADFKDDYDMFGIIDNRWRPSIHLQRTDSRILLEVTSTRVERLQDISRGDVMDEGCPFQNMERGDDPRRWYSELWEKINGQGSWEANPWVWAIEFKRASA